MDPELLAWTSSLAHDRSLVREDLLGSAAHVTMLARVGLIEQGDAAVLRASLLRMFEDAVCNNLVLDDGEEDVHMAIEARLTAELGDVGKRLHTARSRNDQVATALRLHVRDQAASTLRELTALLSSLVDRAAAEADVLLPAYTHRQRAQPISAAFLIMAWTQSLLRAAETVHRAIHSANESPLGCGACSGTSLPIARHEVRNLLGFARLTANALDTIGDRDFELDWTWSGARVLLALSRLATDVIDFTTSEFAFLRIGDAIAAGSSMMPQKKNPDVFELVRGKTGRGVGNVMHMLTLLKGLPTGYARDLQDDRSPTLETGPLVRGGVRAVNLSLVHLTFDRERCLEAISDGSTQATDLAEALVRGGVPFREAYKATGQLVHYAREKNIPLGRVSVDEAKRVHHAFNEAALAVLDPKVATRAKQSAGGTAPERVREHIDSAREHIASLSRAAQAVPSLDDLHARIKASSLS